MRQRFPSLPHWGVAMFGGRSQGGDHVDALVQV